jgi:hypothetical protein
MTTIPTRKQQKFIRKNILEERKDNFIKRFLGKIISLFKKEK